jgi:hypothetical protein
MTTTPIETAPAKLVSIKLLRNYVPMGQHEIVGYHKDARYVKNAAGQMVEIEKAEFVAGQPKPPVQPGVGYPSKLWAGTVVKLPTDEAKRAYDLKIGELAFED